MSQFELSCCLLFAEVEGGQSAGNETRCSAEPRLEGGCTYWLAVGEAENRMLRPLPGSIESGSAPLLMIVPRVDRSIVKKWSGSI